MTATTDLSTQTSTTTTLSTPTHASSTEPLPRKWVARVFGHLAGQLGSKLADLYGGLKSELVQAEWGLGLAGFTGEEIDRGVNACHSRKFAPTLGEFLHLCRPCLDPEMAWREAQAGLSARRQGQDGIWFHPAVWRAACELRDELTHGQFKGHRNVWEHVLRAEFAKGFVEPVPPVPVVVTKNETLIPMPESVRLRLAELGLSLGKGKLCAN
jgi:hypothetical protein